ncbi:hypothetical protein FACS189413_13810 [Bacteroidia bacterium]|nr:hypothetical protein FACS189413_13810 [Bacteroidia bacterium]
MAQIEDFMLTLQKIYLIQEFYETNCFRKGKLSATAYRLDRQAGYQSEEPVSLVDSIKQKN